MTVSIRNRLATFVVVGAPKAGTTSLHRYLEVHPQICMSTPKETNYFLRDDYLDALDEYASCFTKASDVRGETSPEYTNFPKYTGVPERIKRIIPDVKLIYLVRDPIDRAQSQYYQRYFNRGVSRELERAFAEIDDPDHPYIACSKYAMQLERYLSHFPRSSFLIVDTDNLRTDREATLRSVFSFVGADPDFWSPKFEAEHNASRDKVQLSPIAARLHKSRVAMAGRRALPPAMREPLYTTARRILSPRPREPGALSARARARLVEFFRDDAARFRELTGQPFDHWTV